MVSYKMAAAVTKQKKKIMAPALKITCNI